MAPGSSLTHNDLEHTTFSLSESMVLQWSENFSLLETKWYYNMFSLEEELVPSLGMYLCVSRSHPLFHLILNPQQIPPISQAKVWISRPGALLSSWQEESSGKEALRSVKTLVVFPESEMLQSPDSSIMGCLDFLSRCACQELIRARIVWMDFGELQMSYRGLSAVAGYGKPFSASPSHLEQN